MARDRAKTDEIYLLLDAVGAMSVHELARLASRSAHGVRDSLRRLRKDKKIYIREYLPPDSRGRRVPIYAVGDEPDAVEGRASQKQRDKKYRIKMRPVIKARDAVRHGREVNMWRGLF